MTKLYFMYGGTDYYTVLGLDHYATRVEIKQAYRRLAKQHHPDVNPNDPTAEERFQKVNEAYETLYDSSRRVRYDSGFEDAFKTAYTSGTYKTESTKGYTQSGYGYTDFANTYQYGFEDLSFIEKVQLYFKSAFNNLPILHYIVLATIGILLLIIPIDTSLSFKRYTGISMRLMFFVIHMLFSSYWVERSCHNLKDDFMLLPTMVMFTHGAAAILTGIATVMLQAFIALMLNMPRYINDAWSQV